MYGTPLSGVGPSRGLALALGLVELAGPGDELVVEGAED
jgi:hypothetical protein